MRLQRNFIQSLWLATGISWCALAACSEAALAEKEVSGKPQGWEFPNDPNIKWVEDDNGNRFVRFTNDKLNENRILKSTLLLDPSWKSVKISARMRLKDVETGGQGYRAIGIVLDFADSNNKRVEWRPEPFINKDTDWTTVTVTNDVPPGSHQLVLSPGLWGAAGEFSIDDIAVVPNPAAGASDAAGNVLPHGDFQSLSTSTPSSSPAQGPAQILRTVAGIGRAGFDGDGQAALKAHLNAPSNIALDTQGNLYIADSGNHRVRKVTPGGVISTIAGNGIAGFAGDGQAARLARLNTPTGVAVDAGGNLYIADSMNHRVRRILPNGTIVTVAGNGLPGFSGEDAAATSASLHRPEAVAVDAAGNLYIADRLNYRVRKVLPNGIIDTIAGNGSYGYSNDTRGATSAFRAVSGVAVDNSGNVYIADPENGVVRRVDITGTVTTIAGGGSDSGFGVKAATESQLFRPYGVAIDSVGNLFIADTYNHLIRKVDANGFISTVAGSGTAGNRGDNGAATSAQLNHPHGLALDANGKLYIADKINHQVRVLSTRTADAN